MAEIVEEIMNLTLSELKKLTTEDSDSQDYAVVESDSPNCLLKKIPQLKGELVFTVSSDRDAWRVFKGIKREFSTSNWHHNKASRKISIEIDSEPDIKLLNKKNYWSSQEISIDLGQGFSIRNVINKCDLIIDEADKVYLKYGNCTFPVESFLKNMNDFRNDFKINDIYDLARVIQYLPVQSKLVYQDRNILNKVARCFGITKPQPVEGKLDGITKSYARLKDFYLADEDLARAYSFYTLASNSKSTVKNVKTSVIFNKIFEKVETGEEFYALCDKIADLHYKNCGTDNSFYVRIDSGSLVESILDNFEEAREIQKATIKKKSTGAFNKIMNDLDFLTVDKDTHPLTHQAIHEGDIPLGTFFRKNGESYFVYNDNWDLWEEMLKGHREVAIDIAKSCSGRTTYEKDIMSYFYFTLYELPEYLEVNTGKKWKGIPKLVDSADELEPPKEGDNGIAKTRSALTPIVDNEKNEIVVPYVSMRIGGYQTTYCYGLTYSVLKRGFSYMGNSVTKNVEKALNGRDDYGLMFYTLTGSSQGRGYPTFLIIFERLEKSTRVHFHRTHPMRSKDGDYNPVHNWTIGCYKWMIGNVNFERIKSQQGDLAFVQIDNFPEGVPEKVNGYDSHLFETPVDYLPYEKKDRQNILGYIRLDNPTTLKHEEHLNRIIPAGIYEIRQCRSWEANPKGIWSLRID